MGNHIVQSLIRQRWRGVFSRSRFRVYNLVTAFWCKQKSKLYSLQNAWPISDLIQISFVHISNARRGVCMVHVISLRDVPNHRLEEICLWPNYDTSLTTIETPVALRYAYNSSCLPCKKHQAFCYSL